MSHERDRRRQGGVRAKSNSRRNVRLSESYQTYAHGASRDEDARACNMTSTFDGFVVLILEALTGEAYIVWSFIRNS